MKQNRETIRIAVFDCVAETLNIPADELTEDVLIREDLEADSMDVVTLMVLLDDKFNAEFNPEDVPSENVSLKWVVEHIVTTLEDSDDAP
ncbi:MAG: acyl carrier protein [Gammaproteobacteria bacterium]|jgi:acyl carrier protein